MAKKHLVIDPITRIEGHLRIEAIIDENNVVTDAYSSSTMKERTKCEVYSRVVGYIRPIDQWNDAKQAEFKDRKVFNGKQIGKKKQV